MIDTTEQVTTVTPAVWRSVRSPVLAVALMSFSALLLELGLTRLFSVVLFYHFAFLAISIALLGLGAGAVFAFLQREWLGQWTISGLGATLCANSIWIERDAGLRRSRIFARDDAAVDDVWKSTCHADEMSCYNHTLG